MSLRVSIPQLKDSRIYQVIRDIAAAAIDGRVNPLFVDETNQRVGVGTTTPRSATKMDVSGGDIGVSTAGAGINLTTPDGTKTYRAFVDNNGQLSVVRLTVFLLGMFLVTAARAQDAVGSTKTYSALASTQANTADKFFTVTFASAIGGVAGSNGLNVSSDVWLSGDLHLTGAIFPSTAPASLTPYAQLAATQTFSGYDTFTSQVSISTTLYVTSNINALGNLKANLISASASTAQSWTITSTSMQTYTQISTLTLTTEGNPVLASFFCEGGATAANNTVTVGDIVDGSFVDGEDATHGFAFSISNSAVSGNTGLQTIGFTHLHGGLTRGSHSFAVTIGEPTGSGDTFNQNKAACQFFVLEVP